jgi:tetratricopeptide (TPR) repeat protein
VRRTALATTSPLRLRLLHARAGKALEKVEPEAVTAIAEHFEAGCEWSKALHYFTLAAQRAEALFAWQEAESQLERSLQILAHLDPGSTQAEYALKRSDLIKLTELQHLQGHLKQRDAGLLRMQELADENNDTKFTLQTLLLKVQFLNSDARYQDALAVGESGLALAERLGNRGAHARLLAQMGLAQHVLGQPVQALSALQAASSEIDEGEDIALHIQVLGIMGQVYPTLGDYRHALDCVQEAYSLHHKLGDPYGAARYVDIGFLYAQLGRFEEASRFLAESLTIARKASVPGFEAHALLALGGYFSLQGNPVLAIENYQAALQILEGLRRENLSASAIAGIGFSYYHLGDLDRGQDWLERGLESARSVRHRMRVAQVLFQLAMLEISAEQMPTADSRVQEGLAIAREIRAVELISVGLAIMARIERKSGVPDRAKGYAQEALHYAQQYDLLALEMLSRVEIALALVELGRLPSACEHSRAAVLLIPEAHQLWIRAEQVHAVHARVLRRMGEMQAAEEDELCACYNAG